MHPIIENFLERPRSHKIGFWVLSIAVLGYVLWSFVLADKFTERQELSQKIDSLNVEISNERRLARNLDKFRGEVKDLDIKLADALKQLPDEREIPDFLRSIEERARDSGLDVTVFRQLPERHRDFFAEVPVSISVDGSFHQIATFFDEVGRLPRIVNLGNIAISQPQVSDDKLRVKTDCTAVTFRFVPEAERQQREQQKKGESKKRKAR